MRLVIQRVKNASVEVNNKILASIQSGLLVFLGIEHEDYIEDINWLVKKLIKIRIFPDEKHPINTSIEDVGGEFLIISQFTLHASTKKGNRPSFINSASPEKAKDLYNQFLKVLESSTNIPVKSGVFGANMNVSLTNAGPVTIFIDSKNRE